MTRWLLSGVLLLAVAAAASPAPACCDWTARDTAFWQKMSENPRKFSFDQEARPSPYRLVVKDRELRVGPDGADWDQVYHAIAGPRPHTHQAGGHAGAASEKAAAPTQ